MQIFYNQSKQRLPLFNYSTNLESSAFEQAFNLCNLPFAYHHIALMPDAHAGMGMPIGGVMALENYIIPNAVGVDIGCGMNFVSSNIQIPNVSIIKLIMGKIRDEIPVGMKHHAKPQEKKWVPELTDNLEIVKTQEASLRNQVGTLGGGNHFIELQKDENGFLGIMIHSGSRNLGKQVADFYNKKAIELNEVYKSVVPKHFDLAFLHFSSDLGQRYFAEMNYCVQFALSNRKLIMEKICDIISKEFPNIQFSEMINIAHNYAILENHYGKNVVIHRKGATLARQGTIGIIPGSMGTCSYIVEGLGNKESFNSCSHGAGRLMSRSSAKKNLDLQTEINKMNSLGVVHGLRNEGDLDEAPGAYKDIDEVMENQKDLVKITKKLIPVGVVKG